MQVEETKLEQEQEEQEEQEEREEQEKRHIIKGNTLELDQMNGEIFNDIKFIARALSVDKTRDTLTMIYCKEGVLYSTDGHRMHKVDNPNVSIENGLWKVFKNTKTKLVISKDLEGESKSFPECEKVIPEDLSQGFYLKVDNDNIKGISSAIYNFFTHSETCLDIEYLQDAFSMVNNGRLEVYHTDNKSPVVFKHENKLAVIMPILPDNVPEKIEILCKLPKVYIDTEVSSGTLLTNDLIDTIMRYLRTVRHECNLSLDKIDNIQTEIDDAREELSSSEEFRESQLDMILNEDLFNLMNEIAPEGCYYGAHEGDGACFGFWSNPEDNLEE